MKKIIIALMTIILVFGFVSCNASNPIEDNGLVRISVNSETGLTKSISASDVGKTSVKKAYIRFSAIGQDGKDTGTTSSGTEFTVNSETKKFEVLCSSVSNGVIDTSSFTSKYLSQGQWMIEAIGVDAESNILYYGFTNTYISKVNAKVNIKLTPYNAGSSVTGTLAIGTSSSRISSEAVFDEKFSKGSNGLITTQANSQHRVTYVIYDLNGTAVSISEDDGILDAYSISTVSLGTTQETVSYEAKTLTNKLSQGSYVISMTLEQRGTVLKSDGTLDKMDTNWTTSTGGSAVDFGIFGGLTTTISGDIKPSDYIKPTVSATLDTVSDITLTLSNSSGTSLKATATTPAGSTSTVEKYMWFVDGEKQTETSDTFSYSPVPGEHLVQCVAVGKSKSSLTSNDIKSSMKGASVDSTSADVTKYSVTIL